MSKVCSLARHETPSSPPSSVLPGHAAAAQRRDAVVRCVSAAFGLSMRALTTARRARPHAVFARQVSMYLLHVVFSLNPQVIGRLFGKDRSTVAHACQRVEDRRDDAAFDAFLHDLELAVSALDSAIQMRTKQELFVSRNTFAMGEAS